MMQRLPSCISGIAPFQNPAGPLAEASGARSLGVVAEAAVHPGSFPVFLSAAAASFLAASTGLSANRRARRNQADAIVRFVTKAPVQIDGARTDTVVVRGEKELDRYRVTFSADEGADWIKGRVVAVEEGAAGALLTVQLEASREYVALRRTYRSPGQRMQIRVDSSVESLVVASPPVSLAANTGQLWRLKGDIYAGQTKKEAERESFQVAIDVYRPAGSAGVTVGDEIEIGPFTDDGMDLRPVLARFQAPALFFFCDGSAQAVCNLRALMEAENCASELNVRERTALLFCSPSAGLPGPLATWLESAQDKFRLAVADFSPNVEAAWETGGRSAVAELKELQMRIGAVVLGEPAFVQAVSNKLAAEGIKQIATALQVQPLALVLDPEQI